MRNRIARWLRQFANRIDPPIMTATDTVLEPPFLGTYEGRFAGMKVFTNDHIPPHVAILLDSKGELSGIMNLEEA